MTLTVSQTLIAAVTERLPLIVAAALAFAATVLIPVIFKNDPLSRIPFVGAELGGRDKRRTAYMTSAKSIYQDGYQKVRIRLD